MNRTTRFQQQYGPWALATGASDGIGRAFASEAARLHLNVALVARREERLVILAKQIEAAYGVSTAIIPCDLSTQPGRDALMKAIDNIDVGLLIACAGIGTSGPLLHADLKQEHLMWELNCLSGMTKHQKLQTNNLASTER